MDEGFGEFYRKTIVGGANNRAVGLNRRFPRESHDDLIALFGLFLAADKYAIGTDVVDKLSICLSIDHIVHRNHAIPSIIGSASRHEDSMRMHYFYFLCTYGLLPMPATRY